MLYQNEGVLYQNEGAGDRFFFENMYHGAAIEKLRN